MTTTERTMTADEILTRLEEIRIARSGLSDEESRLQREVKFRGMSEVGLGVTELLRNDDLLTKVRLNTRVSLEVESSQLAKHVKNKDARFTFKIKDKAYNATRFGDHLYISPTTGKTDVAAWKLLFGLMAVDGYHVSFQNETEAADIALGAFREQGRIELDRLLADGELKPDGIRIATEEDLLRRLVDEAIEFLKGNPDPEVMNWIENARAIRSGKGVTAP